ncbi:magnesium chelatase subunit D [Octadecabacter sp. G9-8]|uniref:Magnesium chelatase subunit D n=1 Tax=Octadecabacter dasysiphoniae TaxID=2909341 RepID=A0ABS9CZE4_9RHOB|nr:magnesium chelatase subunit D [Octadecabacter dasysiphoniae]MCF2871531.1 magnesium chelatase subunit D [Octadecabacter dasysiphoniae]
MWDRGVLALTLLAIDPAGLGGAIIRARCGPVRDAFRECLDALPQPLLKLHPTMDDETLFGGIDLTETLTLGRLTMRKGILGRNGTAILAMAERCDATLAARLAMALDDGSLQPLIAMDEGAEPDERTPAALGERLAFYIDLNIASSDVGLLPDTAMIESARAGLASVDVLTETYETLVGLCAQLGINSQRAPLFALRAARAHAALHGHTSVTPTDIEAASALCLAHRATVLPPQPQTEEPDATPPDTNEQDTDGGNMEIGALDDRVLEAVLAILPDGLLDQFKPKGSISKGSGAGAKNKSNRRGRPKPSRPGRLSGRNRLDLIATLRTAAPWQKLRGASKGRIKVTPSDFRIKQYEEKSDRLLIFAVDASGSAAMSRLAEAKGAIELLLADAYSRRDHVSLISFRGDTAEVLLPPTRSLVQTKKRLAALPGGGGTPLAAGLIEALTMAHQARTHGMAPCIVLLTDGRANVALDGTANRAKAASDAEQIARQIRTSGTEAITLDLGNRPAKFLADLAANMDGLYMPLPRADARKMSGAVSAALEG